MPTLERVTVSESDPEPDFDWPDCRSRKAVGDDDSDLGARISTFLAAHLSAEDRARCTALFPDFEEVITGRRIPGYTYITAICEMGGIEKEPFGDELVGHESEAALDHRYAHIEVGAVLKVRVPLAHVRDAYAPQLDWPTPEELQAKLEQATNLWEFLTGEGAPPVKISLGKPSVEIKLEPDEAGGG